MTVGGLHNSDEDLCVGCGGPIADQDAVIMYQFWDDRDSDFQSGHLCPDCRPHIEAILERGPARECENPDCDNPFPEAGRIDVREYDDNGYLQDISSICRDCLRRRYCSEK